jgi:cellulose synthase/poly-beta-1,6-N-acetylglucosamine synthase-like glycosyltransferase
VNRTPSHISVLIPARNEETLLPRCLRSVLRAIAELPATVTADVVVVVDSSQDRTREVAERILGVHGTVVTTKAGVVGEARALAAEVALQRYQGPRDACWLANTDADCAVPRNWLLDQLFLAAQGVEAIAGIVDVDSFSEHSFAVAQRFRETYVLHDDGTHPHVHGANLGVRADAYLRAGGWRQLATAEDHDLWDRLLDCGSRRLSVSAVKVLTSGRRVGRAPMGFAGALAAHNEVAA